MHGNEVVGREVLLVLIPYLCEAYNAGDPDIVALIDNTRLHIMPTMNPDGHATAYKEVGIVFYDLGCIVVINSFLSHHAYHGPVDDTISTFNRNLLSNQI